MKKIIFLSIVFTILIIICFHIGYKLPQFDRHSDWTYLDKNIDKNLMIKKGLMASVIIEIPSLNRFIIYSCCNNSNAIVTNQNGKILHKFKDNGQNIFIDAAHNRLIEKTSNYIDGKFIDDSYLAYDLTKLKSSPVEIISKPVNERYEDYLKCLSINLDYDQKKEKELEKKRAIYTSKYRASQAEYILFIKSLKPVLGVYGDKTLTFYLHSDSFGNLYEIYSNADDLHSLEILDEDWEGFGRLSSQYINHNHLNPNFKNFTVADSKTVVKNYFDFTLGINLSGSPYGNNSGPSLSIEQKYLNYFSLKIKKQKFYFKISDYDSDGINQLNTPKSDNDTLFFMYEKSLYQAYLRNKN